MSTSAAIEDDPAHYGKHAIPWAKIFRSRPIIALTISYFAFVYVAWMFFAWIYIYMAQARGLNLKTSAIYSMFPFIAMTVGCLLGGVVSDWVAARFGLRMGRCLLPGIALALTAVLLLLGSSAHDARTAALVLAASVGALYLAQSNFWAVSADVAGEFTGVVSGMMNMGGQIGGACAASLTPWIAAHYGWNMAFIAAASLVVVGALAWIVIDPHELLMPTEIANATDSRVAR
jgi:ACS family glucarate transporter-like MFS transporter